MNTVHSFYHFDGTHDALAFNAANSYLDSLPQRLSLSMNDDAFATGA